MPIAGSPKMLHWKIFRCSNTCDRKFNLVTTKIGGKDCSGGRHQGVAFPLAVYTFMHLDEPNKNITCISLLNLADRPEQTAVVRGLQTSFITSRSSMSCTKHVSERISFSPHPPAARVRKQLHQRSHSNGKLPPSPAIQLSCSHWIQAGVVVRA